MNVEKGLVAGIAILVVGFGFNWLVGVLVPSVQAEYENPAIFRSWQDPLMMAYFAYPFILGVVAAYLWDKLKAKDALEFAKTYFIIATIPGMFITLSSFQVSYLMVASWTVVGFLEVLVAGWVFTKVK